MAGGNRPTLAPRERFRGVAVVCRRVVVACVVLCCVVDNVPAAAIIGAGCVMNKPIRTFAMLLALCSATQASVRSQVIPAEAGLSKERLGRIKIAMEKAI